MSIDYDLLFGPLNAGPLTLRNRIVCPPMVTMRNIIGEDGIEWYGRMAQGGAGLVIVEATAINRFGTELTAENLKHLTGAVHRGGAAIAIQLFPVTFGCKVTPPGLSVDSLALITRQYADAAKICFEAGFDGVEPHGAHGYVLNQFLSPEQNTRTDAYGGPLENRMRWGLEIVQAIRETIGRERLILYRLSPKGPGYDLADSLPFAARLVEAGVGLLDLSPSSEEAPGDLAAPFKARLDVPVITVGHMNADGRGAQAIREGRADLVAIGRELITDPFWPSKVREGRFDEIVECVRCDKKCFGYLRRNKPIACTQWPDDSGPKL